MPKFKDVEGREWDVLVDIEAARRCRKLLGFDLLGKDLGGTVTELVSDPVRLVDVLFVVLQPDADKAGITDVQFGRAMRGDAIEAAERALLEALADFFPSQQRDQMRRLLATMEKATTAMRMEAEKAVAQVEAAIGQTSTEPPASPVSGLEKSEG